MNSISTKIRIAMLVGIATLVGIVLYVKADRTAEDESMESSYTVKSSPTTNLNAVMNAHPRANEYTSSEYTSKMAPNTTEASEYLALYESMKAEDYSFQDNTGGYKRKTAPTTVQGQVPDKGAKTIKGQRAAQSNSDAYESFGVRSAVVRNDTIVEQREDLEETEEEEEEEEDPRLQIATDVKQRVVGVDNYSKTLKNAEANDDAYQTDNTQSAANPYKGYKVRSADRDKASYASTIDEDGYARKSAPQGTKDDSQATNTTKTHEGYAVKSAATSSSLATTDGYSRKRAPQGTEQNATSLAQYDNAKGNDKAYQADNVAQEGKTIDGYAIRSPKKNAMSQNVASEDGYSRKRAPQGSNTAPVKDYANTTKANSETGGYAVRSAGKKATAQNLAATDESGYARRRAPLVTGQKATNLAQYDNATQNDGAYKTAPTVTEGGYAIRSPKAKYNNATAKTVDGYNRKSAPQANSSSREYAQTESQEMYEGYAVRSAGKRNTQPTNNAIAQNSTPRPKGGVPASSGLKMYGSRGERLAANTSQKDRSVIVMPKRGRSFAGTVVQDDPGRSIIVESSTGVQSSYKYGEIDALVNL